MNRIHTRGIKQAIGEPFSLSTPSYGEQAETLGYALEQTFPGMEPENLSLEDLTAADELLKEWDKQNMRKEKAE